MLCGSIALWSRKNKQQTQDIRDFITHSGGKHISNLKSVFSNKSQDCLNTTTAAQIKWNQNDIGIVTYFRSER